MTHHDWQLPAEPRRDLKIEPLPPQAAERAFLARFAALFPEHAAEGRRGERRSA